jgi:hypothetical protein
VNRDLSCPSYEKCKAFAHMIIKIPGQKIREGIK